MASVELETPCNICKAVSKKYTCPRCNTDYCSLICYQSAEHVQCTESFYQKCVLDEMSISTDDDESKQKMMEAFTRMQEPMEFNLADNDYDDDDDILDSDDDANCASLGDRLANIDLDNTDQVLAKLTEDEKQQFQAMLRSGDIGKLIPKWQPWWLLHHDGKIQEVGVATSSIQTYPKIKEDIKEFTSITKSVPNACVSYNLANIICAYAVTARFFNGCHLELLEEAVNYIISLSLTLDTNCCFQDIDAAIKSVHQQWIKVTSFSGIPKIECVPNSIEYEEYITNMSEDTRLILRGPSLWNKKQYILCALSDLHNLMSSLLIRKKGKKSDIAPEQKHKIKLCLKKLEYCLSYTLYVDNLDMFL